MKVNLWDLLSGKGFTIPTPHINVVSIMKEEHMNLLDFIHLPAWAPFAGIGLGLLLLIILLGSIKSLIGWPGLAALAIVLALGGGAFYGAHRALAWDHAHYHIKGHVTDLASVFL